MDFKIPDWSPSQVEILCIFNYKLMLFELFTSQFYCFLCFDSAGLVLQIMFAL